MDVKHIATFVQVAEHGSFSRAASVLKVAQPALSRQVRALEVALRQPLFDRNGRGVTLTPAGQRLLAHGRGILQQLERARQDLEDLRGVAAGLMSVGLPPSIGRVLTAPLVEAFALHFPKATLSMVEGLSTYTLEWLAQGRIDCAVVYNTAPTPAIRLLPVLDEKLYLVGARREAADGTGGTGGLGRPVTLAQVAQQALLIPSRPHAIRMRLEAVLAEGGLKSRVGLEIESVPAILDLVQRHPEQRWHAVLSLNAIRGSGREQAFIARPIHLGGSAARRQPLTTSLSIATSAQRPRGPLLDQASALLAGLLQAHLAGAVPASLQRTL